MIGFQTGGAANGEWRGWQRINCLCKRLNCTLRRVCR